MSLFSNANSIFTGDKLLAAPNAVDARYSALFAKLGLTALKDDEMMRVSRVPEAVE